MTESAQTFAKRYQELTGTKVNWGRLAKMLEDQLTVKYVIPAGLVKPNAIGKITGLSLKEAKTSPSVQAAKLMPALRPPNSFTLAEYARDNNVSYTGARNAIRKLREAGKIRSVKMPVTYSNGYTVTTCGWELVGEGK